MKQRGVLVGTGGVKPLHLLFYIFLTSHPALAFWTNPDSIVKC